jgi:hypothetical protein
MGTRAANHVLPHLLALFQGFILNGGPLIYGCLLPSAPQDLHVGPHC